MRAVAFLFALYFAVLGCLACADEPARAAPTGVATVQAAPPAGEQPALGDWCSPLCQCHCCAGVTLPQPLLQVAFRQPVAPGYAAPRYAAWPRPAVPTRAPAAPWQPPRRA